MKDNRVKFSLILQNQLPQYIREEYPLISEFLSQYYISQEYQGSASDLIQNIDEYIKVDNQTNITESATLLSDISFNDETILLNLDTSESGTNDFPDSYGLIQIDNEIITYTGKTFNSFTGCIRGFSGLIENDGENDLEEFKFSSSESTSHKSGSKIINLTSLFLKKFLTKIKYQYLPGLENRPLSEDLNQSLFIKQSKDFYNSKGTDLSFEILFKSLYNENVKVVRPRDYIFKPSDASYQVTKDIIVESLEGDPFDLINSTLYQDEYNSYTKAYAPISSVERILDPIGNYYYRLSFDANYDRDIRVDGALYGKFNIHSKTKVIGNVSSGSSTIDVDSTIGFPSSGELYVKYEDGTEGVITYQSKNYNQFKNCSGIDKKINDGENIRINTFARNYDSTVKVKINSIVKDIELIDNARYLKSGDPVIIKSIGANAKDKASNNWFFNISPNYEVKVIELKDNINNIYKLELSSKHIFNVKDKLEIRSETQFSTGTVVKLETDTSFLIKCESILFLTENFSVKRSLLKFNSSSYNNLGDELSNVQNVYKIKERTLISSQSLPYYGDEGTNPSKKEIVISGTYPSESNDIFTITSNTDHGFYTGDLVYYTPEKVEISSIDIEGNQTVTYIIQSQLFDEGVYAIERVDPYRVKFAKSKSDIYNSNYITLDNPVSVSSNKIQYYKLSTKTLKAQNLLREISPPINDGNRYPTIAGSRTGILINGVEILNYKSTDLIYYGQIEKINVVSGGNNYDVINPPNLLISDGIGVGATGFCSVKGSLVRIDIVDPGFDYTSTPTISIVGGNGSGAVAQANMKLIDHSVSFNSEISANRIGIGTSFSTVGFTTYHKFRNAERVIYLTNGQKGISGLSTNSTYYVSPKDPYTIKLHKTYNDVISGINTIVLGDYGIGIHEFRSFNKKSVISSINVVDPGSGYENKLKSISHTGINTFSNKISIEDHGYQSGEIVVYKVNGTPISGLSSNTEYYVTKVDKNNFKLSAVGVGSTNRDFYYKSNQFLKFNTQGFGTHIFNYPEIKVLISENIGISSVNQSTFGAIVNPVFRGEVASIHLSNKGSKYGSSKILNYNKQPLVELTFGSGAALTPIVSQGRIKEVLVNNGGTGYTSSPNIIIAGEGFGAYLTAIVKNGSIKEIKVIESGTGYKQNTTSVTAVDPSNGSKFECDIQKWNVNLFEKYLNSLTEDDGIITPSINSDYGLQYTHLYAPRKLRESVYSTNAEGNSLYGRPDLLKINDIETTSAYHSPIIGWAYDGNPIYGPYGYATKSGGTITQIKSGYKLDLSIDTDNRPSIEQYPLGFFIEDYKFYKTDNEDTLDENNGRFCITPEFPNGTYAYFATVSPINTDSSGVFFRYKRPVFPYLIGNSYNSKPIDFNFKKLSNQDEIDLNLTDWVRNTYPYNLQKDNKSYQYLNTLNLYVESAKITYSTPGTIDDINIISRGENYKVGDFITFKDDRTDKFTNSAKVTEIIGKSISQISVASSSTSDVEFYNIDSKTKVRVFTENPHDYKTGDIIFVSGLSTSVNLINDYSFVEIDRNVISLASSVSNSAVTGIVTYFSVSGNLLFPNIRENDILTIGSEDVKVLNIDRKSSRIRVLREVNGSVGSAHSESELLYENSRKLTINLDLNVSNTDRINTEIYFNPSESLGIGTRFAPGIGKTIVFSNPGAGLTSLFVPSRSIYIPNHNLQTGDELIYSPNGGSSIGVSTNGINSYSLQNQSIVYVAKISEDLIGISSVKVGLGSTGNFVGIASTTRRIGTLFFTGIGTGQVHSFKTNYKVLTGKIQKDTVTVSTAETHGLIDNDFVRIDVNPSISTSFTIKYDDTSRRLLIDPKSFIAGDVNTTKDIITITNHGFKTGQKVLHTSSSPSGGLRNGEFYYVFVYDRNQIKLTDNYYETTLINPKFVNITSASFGTLSLVNPSLRVYKNCTLNFDLSDSSLSYLNGSTKISAFDLLFYNDSNFKNEFNRIENSNLNIKKYGEIGISTDAIISIEVNDNIPNVLYYRLVPIYKDTNLPETKKTIVIDDEVISNNQIQIYNSEYNGRHQVIVGSTTSFTYNLRSYPEKDSYSSPSTLKYFTNSPYAFGPINKLEILNYGQKYPNLLGISSSITKSGYNAIVDASSNSIGGSPKIKINNFGYDFSSDFTLKPSAGLPQVIKISSLSSFDYIGISSFGVGYNTPPRLLVIDAITNNPVTEVDLRYSIGSNKVEILKNAYSLNNFIPKIIPIENSNGVGISSVAYNPVNKNVTVTLSVGFSTSNSFPFSVNDKVLIENVSVGIASTAKGYNSRDYNYQLFKLIDVDANLGGIGSVTYNLSGLLSDSEFPGTFNSFNSSGRIIPEKHFPIFDIKLKSNDFYEDEIVRSNSSIGRVIDWDAKTKYLRIISKDDFNSGDLVVGDISKSQGTASSVERFDSFFNLGSYCRNESGWNLNRGFLNDNLQRIQDSFYYQNFSYSLKSKIDYDTWNEAVSSLNHTLGFKKFSDYQLESRDDISTTVGITTNLSYFSIIKDIVSYADLNCVYDFDLVKENSIESYSTAFSDEIIFENRILTDYTESVGNRVLIIDDISKNFNSNPRSERFSEAFRFNISDARAQKTLIYVRDKRYYNQLQFSIITLLHDNSLAYINQYGRVESSYDLGYFDFNITGSEGVILFYPNNFRLNDFDMTSISFNLKDSFTGIASTSVGDSVNILTSNTTISAGSTVEIIQIPSTYTSAKILVEVSNDSNEHEFNEINITQNGTDFEFLEYGKLTTVPSVFGPIAGDVGLGSYYAYKDGSDIKVQFIPNKIFDANVNIIQIAIADSSVTGVGSFDIKNAKVQSTTTSISSSPTPTENVIFQYDDNYDGAYCLVQVYDTTNNQSQLSEIIIADDANEGFGYVGDIYLTEFASIETLTGIGTIGAKRVSGVTQLTFVPNPNINVQVKVFSNSLRLIDIDTEVNSAFDNVIESDYGFYTGTERDIKKSFELTYKDYPIFERIFNASNPGIANTFTDTINLDYHFFVTGEKVKYQYATKPIGIAATYFGVGIGTTNKLPSEVYIVKLNENTVKLARSAEDALRFVPKTIDLVDIVGIGSIHKFTAINQNPKVIIALDNMIQSPIVATSVTTVLASSLDVTENTAFLVGINSFFSGDLIKIGQEVMRIEGVGIGTTNSIRVIRPWLGTSVAGYSTGSLVTKVAGNYNIVGNTINFAESPYGNIPFSTSTNPPDERDWLGVSTSSSFHGRVFLRSGNVNGSEETYQKNYVFDDISQEFNGKNKNFTIKSNYSNITGISDKNAVVLVNGIFQGPGFISNYTLSENTGVTSITFVSDTTTVSADINVSDLPRGGVIISVGSTEGFGYQPLISAGGTATVSAAGTISAISIGNSGSGYRLGIHTLGGTRPVTVRVGVATSSLGTPNIAFIGTAAVSNGRIVSVAITNPGFGYTSSNPPIVVFDSPISYSNMPLFYRSSSGGIGTQARIDIVVGQGSSIVDFEITNTGYSYGQGDILTVPIGGIAGIPTVSTYKPFEIVVQNTYNDKFSGWSIGELQVIDSIDNLFDGSNLSFPLRISGSLISILSSKGSNINVQDTLLVFVNDVLQIPGEGYTFTGGSIITFTEAPKEDDTCKIIFYRGSGSIDVIERNILETVKPGDKLRITYDSSIGQSPILLEDERIVTDVLSTDLVETNPYYGPGNTSDENLIRPVTLCRQTEDRIINQKEIGKDRDLYESLIYPQSYLIQSVGIGSTVIFVDNIRPFFNQINENNISLAFQNKITLISQDSLIAAAGTAVVSAAGTVSRIVISSGGVGYSTSPSISIENPVGLGTTQRANATSTISIGGTVSSIRITSPGFGYTSANPPVVLIEPPTRKPEIIPVNQYEGDSGIIVGVATTSIAGVGSTALIFDLFIPFDSFLRNQSVTGVTTISSIQQSYYFVVYDSNVGRGVTTLTAQGSVIGIGTSCIDNVYQVSSVSITQRSITGIGSTFIARVTARISSAGGITGISGTSFYGRYSWGRISLEERSSQNQYSAYLRNGVTGLTTGGIVYRSNPLKYKNYIS